MSSVHGSSRASGYTATESTWSPSGGKTAKASNHHSTSLYAQDDLRHIDIWYQMNWYLNTIV